MTCARGHNAGRYARRQCRDCDRERKTTPAYRSQQRRYFTRRGSLLRLNRTADRALQEWEAR